MMKAVACAVGLALVSCSARAESSGPSTVTVHEAWSRPAAAGTNGAGFFTITNAGRTPQTLLSVSSPAAGRVEMHETSMANGVMSMQALTGGLVLPPGQSLTFAPGGRHLMLLGLKAALRNGDTVPLTFRLASGRRIETQATVRVSPPQSMHQK